MKFSVARTSALPAKRKARWGEKRCIWCNRACRVRPHAQIMHKTLATREHLVPRSFGGGGGSNLVTACRECNNARRTDMRWIPWSEVPGTIRAQPVAYARIGGEIVVVRDYRRASRPGAAS